MPICTKCKIDYSEEYFYSHKRKDIKNPKKKQLSYTCKFCDKKIRSETKYDKRYHLKKNYGLTLDIFNSLLELQENKCAICKSEFTETNIPHIDHCHKTGNIREILCRMCNMSLGMVKDDITILSTMIQY